MKQYRQYNKSRRISILIVFLHLSLFYMCCCVIEGKRASRGSKIKSHEALIRPRRSYYNIHRSHVSGFCDNPRNLRSSKCSLRNTSHERKPHQRAHRQRYKKNTRHRRYQRRHRKQPRTGELTRNKQNEETVITPQTEECPVV